MQTLVDAIRGYDYVTGVIPVIQDVKEIGYTFTKSAPITTCHGADGQDGDAFLAMFFRTRTMSISPPLSGGERIEVPKCHPLFVSFSEMEAIRVPPNETYTIDDYTNYGPDENKVTKALAQDGFRAVVKETDLSTGVIETAIPETILLT